MIDSKRRRVMTILQIQAFCAVTELKSMTLAAARLNMTQPGVSRMIAELEKEYDTKLFSRENKTLRLTYEGQQCYVDALQVLKDLEIMKARLGKARPLDFIHIGCTTGLGPLIFPEVKRRFEMAYPTCRLYITEGRTKMMLSKVSNQEFSFAFIQEQIYDTALESRKFCKDRLKVVAAPGYRPRCGKEVLSIEDLSKEDLILITPSSGIRKQIDLYASSMNVALKPIWECNSGDNAVCIAEQGFGLSILANITVDKKLREGSLMEISTDFSITRDYCAVWKKEHVFTEEEQYLMDLCLKAGAEVSV